MWFYNLIRLCGFIEEFSEVKIVSVIGGWIRIYSKVKDLVWGGGGYLIVFIFKKKMSFSKELKFFIKII